MIIEVLLNLIKGLLNIVFGWISLPSLPTEITDSIEGFLFLIFSNLQLLGFFIPPFVIFTAVPLLIIAVNFERVYKLTMWILRKIPFFNMN